MSDAIIQVRNIAKQYKLGLRTKVNRDMRETLVHMLTAPLRRFRHLGEGTSATEDLFWALDDVSFDVRRGEVVGIIGRNGAGKSTLLKVLSRITEPTRGQAVIHGRVASLLEVGTGFHPDLTGRENIYLNGAILGMRHAEIKQKFDEIVAFAEIDKFLDTPVKRYSSGMRVRLGFSVAAHLNPEILIIDEILAVGDFAFQKKCLGKMEDVAHGGRTVLFVSHNMGAVQELCTRGILLKDGRVIQDGPTDDIIAEYLAQSSSGPHGFKTERDTSKLFQILEVTAMDGQGRPKLTFDVAEPIVIHIKYAMDVSLEGSVLVLDLARQGMVVVKSYDTDQMPELLNRRSAGMHTATITIPPMFLKPGSYSTAAGLSIARQRVLDKVDGAAAFDIVSKSMAETYKGFASGQPGMVIFPGTWQQAD